MFFKIFESHTFIDVDIFLSMQINNVILTDSDVIEKRNTR